MFPKNRISIIYRILCLLSFIGVILVINSQRTLIILLVIYGIFSLVERNFRNIELSVISLIVLLICAGLKNYILLRIMLLIDYSIYFIDTSYYDEIEENENTKRYVYLKKQKKKGINNISAIYVTLHLVLLIIVIMVG